MYWQYLGIFFFGGLGCLTRYSLNLFYPRPYWLSTFLSNTIGCFLIGICFGFLHLQKGNSSFLNILIVGFLGGLTTFSSWNLQIFKWIQIGQIWSPFFYILASIALGLICLFAGFKIVFIF